ncbi:nucleotidyltransferase family protein [Ornithinibacillus contaminans]|uniref:nucleotidyltransferase family protein n=1 Tax=Ornithinibacillus contaminans TaxID=694055 RepID=UPI00064DDA50|nr:nucleotidyltransferase family protein [Ornithinibacillus contaminans]
MQLQNEKDIYDIIQQDTTMMEILKAAHTLDLPDWWICAGFVRSKIWDVLHDFTQPTIIDDVDLVYFDKFTTDEAMEKEYENRLKQLLPSVPWSVKNEARMHLRNGIDPYTSTVDAISKFPETVTALGVKLIRNGELRLTAPHGVEDVLNLTVRPTPDCKCSDAQMKIYYKRIKSKNWKATWNKVTYLDA